MRSPLFGEDMDMMVISKNRTMRELAEIEEIDENEMVSPD